MLVRTFYQRSYVLTKLHRINSSLVKSFNSLSVDSVPEVTHAEIKKHLKQSGTTFEDGYTSFIISCPLCPKAGKKSGTDIYINKMTGNYNATV